MVVRLLSFCLPKHNSFRRQSCIERCKRSASSNKQKVTSKSNSVHIIYREIAPLMNKIFFDCLIDQYFMTVKYSWTTNDTQKAVPTGLEPVPT